MNIKVEDLKNYEEVPEGLLKIVKNLIKQISNNEENNFMEKDFVFGYEGDIITSNYLGKSEWTDRGKYQYQSEDRQLVAKEYKKIIKYYNLFFNLPVTRKGSYSSDYYYIYEEPTIQIANIKHIPEQIIPAHDIVDFTEV